MADYTYDPATPEGQVRLLVCDVAEPWVFTDAEVAAFLSLEGDSVKRAAALAIDANATNEVLVSKVIRDQDVSTDGAKAAEALRKLAQALRDQADKVDDAADGGFFDIVPDVSQGWPELVRETPFYPGWLH